MANLKLPQLDTKSMLDIVNENFDNAKLKNFANRLILAGEHLVKKEILIKQMGKSIKAVNSGYVDIPLTGALFAYESYFVHILEASEDIIHRQLRFQFSIEAEWIEETWKQEVKDAEDAAEAKRAWAEEEGLDIIVPPVIPEEIPRRKIFKDMTVLMIYHSVTTIYFDKWRAFSVKPPSLVGRLDIFSPMEQHMEQLRICLNKCKKLCTLVSADEKFSFEGLSANDPKMEGLPEVALLDFLIHSPYTTSLKEILSIHRHIYDYKFYFEQVWPLPTHYTPRYLYKLKIDDSFVPPLPVMPWEIKQKEETEEGEDQRSQEADSDSD